MLIYKKAYENIVKSVGYPLKKHKELSEIFITQLCLRFLTLFLKRVLSEKK